MAVYNVTKRDLPNVWSHTFKPIGEGQEITLYRAIPGDTSPYFVLGKSTTKVVRPERFGPYETRKEFEQWCSNFVHNREVARAA